MNDTTTRDQQQEKGKLGASSPDGSRSMDHNESKLLAAAAPRHPQRAVTQGCVPAQQPQLVVVGNHPTAKTRQASSSTSSRTARPVDFLDRSHTPSEELTVRKAVAARYSHANNSSSEELLKDVNHHLESALLLGRPAPLPSSPPPVPSQPGAHAQRGIAWSGEFSEELTMGVDAVSSSLSPPLAPQEEENPPTQQQLGYNHHHGLVEADPVPDSQQFAPQDLEVARAVAPHQQQKREKEKRTTLTYARPYHLLACVFICMVLVFPSALILIGVLVVKAGEEDNNSTTIAPTTSTIAPTNDRLLSHLPQPTINTINQDVDSPQARAFQWVLNDPHMGSYTDDRLVQQFALATFYYSTGGNEKWIHKGGGTVRITFHKPGRRQLQPCQANNDTSTGSPPDSPDLAGSPGCEIEAPTLNVTTEQWLDYNSTHECDWFSSFGIRMCEEGSDDIFMLDLKQNNLQGTLPAQLALLTTLNEIGLQKNGITGKLPTEFGTMPNLEQVKLIHNQLTGGIPPQWGRSRTLFKLGLANNNLEGSLPTELYRLSLMQDLFLARNQLTGTLPRNLCEVYPLLKQLNLSDGNRLTGTLPESIGRCTNLQVLDLRGNSMSGTLPSDLGLLDDTLFQIKLTDNQLSGRIPSQLGLLTVLAFLEVEGNANLTGPLPTQLGLLTQQLESFRIQGTALTGIIPPALCNVTRFDCSPALCGCGDCPCYY